MDNADTLVMSGLVDMDKVVAMALNIESFRKSEAGTAENAGDVLSKWLSEEERKPKVKSKGKDN